MRSPWGESNYRNEGGGDDRSNGYDRGGGAGSGGGSISHGLLGSLIERSTSAPPMSTESGLSFGDGNSGSLFGREQRAAEREQSTMAPLYENNRNNRDDRGAAGPEGTFLARPQAGRASGSPSYSKPDFTSLLPDGLGPESASSSSKVLDDKGLDFSEAGAAIIRSQSAAPTFHGRSPLFPPPGLAEIKESQPTPSTVDSYSTQPSTVDSYSSSHSNSTTNFESAIDRGADIMKVGQRRSHSTSAIGNGGLYSSPRDGGGGGLRSNTLMSMGILEEDPPENGHGGPTRVPIQQDNYDNYHHRPDNNRHQQTHQTHSPVPPHMQQPQPHQQRTGPGGGEPQYVYAQQPQQHPQQLPPPHQQQHQPQYQPHQHQVQQHPPPPHQPHQHQPPQVHLQQPQYVTHRADPHNPHEPPRNVMQQQPPLRTARDPYEVQAPPMGAPMAAAPMGQMQGDPMRAGQPQYVTLADHGIPGEPPRAQSSIYAPAVPHGGHPVHRAAPPPPPPQAAEAQRQIYYGGQPQQVDVQTPVLTQSGQTVYLNAPAAPYGYATVQYHPHQQPQIIRQTVPGRGHPHEQFVSVVPIQGGPAQLASIAGSGQTYAYWQPDGGGAPLAVPQVTIMNAAGPGGAPIAVARIGNPAMESQHSNNGYRESGRGGKEKGRKGRRDGGTPSRRGGDTKHSSHSMSSPLLDEFRATKSRDWTIRDIEGHVVEFCQDQNGSRFIQQRLEIGDNTEQKLVMNEVLPAIHRLRNDVFGNYVVQKLLEFGTNQMKSDIRDTLQGEMLQLSLQMYGCRVVQKALETLDEDDLPRLLKEFHHNVLSCIHDQNGNHVIQKCIEVMSNRAKKAREIGDDAKADFLSEQIDFVVDDVLGNTASLSCHPYGCRVLQRILEHCIESKKTAALDEISKCHKTLLDDQYGNYVIQHVLQFGRQEDRESILHIVVENGLLSLSKQKFASNVVEKLLKYGTAEQRKAVVREMLKVVDDQTGAVGPAGGSGGSSVVLLMVRDAYANYVVQTTIDVVPECEERKLLLDELNAHAAELRNYTFAKHIMQKLSA